MTFMEPVTVRGTVKHFKGNGRKFGYPTANISTDTSLQDGIYFGRANLKEFTNHPAIIFIGAPTTLGDHEKRIEVHLLDIPDLDYYDSKIAARVEHFHRPNQTFADVDTLLKAMHDDERMARAWFEEFSNGKILT